MRTGDAAITNEQCVLSGAGHTAFRDARRDVARHAIRGRAAWLRLEAGGTPPIPKIVCDQPMGMGRSENSCSGLASAPAFGIGARVLCGVLLMVFLALQHRVAAEERLKPFKMRTLEGVMTSLSDVRGKVTLIVFFFPSCGFCNLALPEVQKLHGRYSDRGLSMVWINVVPEEERLIAAWRARHGYSVPILLGGRSVQDDYRVSGTPTHCLIDGQGKVLWRHEGYKPGDERDLERRIRLALGLVN
jgi:thiol-disulfide isomerase/thioredoxin